MSRARIGRFFLYLILIFFVILFLLPLWSALVTALKTEEDLIYTTPIEPPQNPTLEPLKTTLSVMGRPLLNSLSFTLGATLLSCLFGSIAGYILTKIKFPGSGLIFGLIILGIFIPYQAVLVPLVLTMVRLGLYNTIWGLILTHTAYGIPICTLLFRSFYEDIPDSLIRAAQIDGAGTWTIYRRVVLPLSWLPFAVAGVFQFTSIWNDLLIGLVLSRGVEAMPASVALANLKGGFVALWNLQMAGTLWYALPALIVYFLLGKYLIRGYMAGAIKG
ncbi:MAG: carbohydrate ABC transporter permease [Caldiserica bacterium]|jgi:glucose/mannose transport system permease protein|nr:carbohydrate ABC transporter permease [Caldisericota bacterium]MDH7562150.1 carbohydrate ABC transporter permease [Caldisericota bacterium]